MRTGDGVLKVRQCGEEGQGAKLAPFFTLVLQVVSNQLCPETSGIALSRLATPVWVIHI